MTTDSKQNAFSLFGLGAAACVACCAGPLLAFFGGLGIAGLASTAHIGVAGLVLTALAIVGFAVARRRSTACSAPADEATPVAAPVRRQPAQETAR